MSGTALGRWFLDEYMRRHRTPETQLMLDAIAELEAAVLKPRNQAGLVSVLGELAAIRDTIARARQEIAQIDPPDGFDTQRKSATDARNQSGEASDRTTPAILSAAEDIQEIAWTLRENGVAPELCDRIDRHAVDIYTACSSQDTAGQRADQALRTLRLIEQRIEATVEVWRVDDGTRRIGKGAARAEHQDPEEVSQARPTGEQSAAQAPEALEPPRTPQYERFERPDPLTLPQLPPVKRAALFG